MDQNHFKTRQQIAQELGVSYSTFYRKLKKANIEVKGNLINQDVELKIKQLFIPSYNSNPNKRGSTPHL